MAATSQRTSAHKKHKNNPDHFPHLRESKCIKFALALAKKNPLILDIRLLSSASLNHWYVLVIEERRPQHGTIELSDDTAPSPGDILKAFHNYRLTKEEKAHHNFWYKFWETINNKLPSLYQFPSAADEKEWLFTSYYEGETLTAPVLSDYCWQLYTRKKR